MPTSGDTLLTLRSWSLDRVGRDGKRTLLADIDFDLVAGRWLAIIGPNGSGKSSLLKYLAGPESPLEHRTAILCQDPDEQLFAASVAQELTLGHADWDPKPWLDDFGLVGLDDLDPRVLSAGQKQRLALAVALATRPRVLLCDEPTALQDRHQSAWVLDRIDRWRRQTGGALVTATCDGREAARADQLLVLGDGCVVAHGSPAQVLARESVRDLLWRQAEEETGRTPPTPPAPTDAPAVLSLEGVNCRFTGPGDGFREVALRMGSGERVGLTGPSGCGKSTLLLVCAGVRRPDAGTVDLAGRRLYRRGARDLDHGAALLAPQFPEYLFTHTTVRQELALDPQLATWSPDEFLNSISLAAELAANHPLDLSGGQRRRLALGLVLRSGRPLLLLDEPTAGLDGPGRRLVLELLGSLPATTSLLVASHDREFLVAAGCRIRRLGPAGLSADES